MNNTLAGCYSPALHPEAGDAGGTASWILLDSVPDPRVVHQSGLRVRYVLPRTDPYGWEGWWKPLGGDSAEVVWTFGHVSHIFIMRAEGNRLVGHAQGYSDADTTTRVLGPAVTWRRDVTSCSPSENGS
jgi:hypothetical protein